MAFTPIVSGDFSVASNGDIRYTGAGGPAAQRYSVLALHHWLQKLSDDNAYAGDDMLSILSDNPSSLEGPRSDTKPMTLNLLAPFNVDDDTATYFNFGSILNKGTNNQLYTGVKTIGSPLVDLSPMYVIQGGVKISKFWQDLGHIQIMCKSVGDVEVFSRKYGQTYSNFPVPLTAGSEQPASISTKPTSDWTTLTKEDALAVPDIVITVGDVTTAPAGVTPTRLYKGTIAISGNTTIAQAAQYCQAICAEGSTVQIGSIDGEQFKSLNGYVPNSAAPFGEVAGGKWIVAKGWWVANTSSQAGVDSQAYQVTATDDVIVKNPVQVSIRIDNLITDVQVVCGRYNGVNDFVKDEYSVKTQVSGGTSIAVNEPIKIDTPDSGYIRVNGVPYTYSAVDRTNKIFTVSPAVAVTHTVGQLAWCPFIDTKATTGTTGSPSSISSTGFTRVGAFQALVRARKGSTSPYLKPANANFPVDAGVAAYGVIMDSDE